MSIKICITNNKLYFQKNYNLLDLLDPTVGWKICKIAFDNRNWKSSLQEVNIAEIDHKQIFKNNKSRKQ